MKSYLNRSPLNQAGFILLLLAAVTTVNQRHCHAESRLLVKATRELPRHGEGSLLTLDNGRLLLVYT
ncbi:MAG: hypothetical protein KDA74_10675, partial [Planctomycetaceae bacterium]|nr:hypothetical protein [Planctomycetaceae bacterium]